MRKSILFFVAVLFPQEISDHIRRFQLDAARYFKSYKSLNSPPHITLVPPFRWPRDEMHSLHNALEQVSLSFKPFSLTLNGFGHFSPRVIYVSIDTGDSISVLFESLHKMCKDQLDLDVEKRDAFHPHVTIAYRDLKRSLFHDAWDFFKAKNITFQVKIDKIYLLKHDANMWRIGESFPFNSSPTDNVPGHLS